MSSTAARAAAKENDLLRLNELVSCCQSDRGNTASSALKPFAIACEGKATPKTTDKSVVFG
jgi:hypothetical protein